MKSKETEDRANLIAVCEEFVELFWKFDMRPEDECHELYQRVRQVLAKVEEPKETEDRANLIAVCEKFVELFRTSDMRPEDECHELYQRVQQVLAKAKGPKCAKKNRRTKEPKS